jgi:hypothetical protein
MAEETAVAVATETTEVPIGEVSQAEYKKARAEGKGAGDTIERKLEVPEETGEEQSGAEEKPPQSKQKSRGGLQVKLDRATKEIHELKAKLNTQAASPEPEEEAAAVDPEQRESTPTGKLPSQDDYVNPQDFVRDKIKFLDQNAPKRANYGEDEARYLDDAFHWRKEKEETVLIGRSYSEIADRIKGAEYRHSDFRDLLETTKAKVPNFVYPLLITEAGKDETIDFIYYLMKNPDEAEKINNLPPERAKRAAQKMLDDLESGLLSLQETEEREETEEVEQKAGTINEKPKRRAPAPIRPVHGGATHTTSPLDTMKFSDFRKTRNNQLGR